MKGKTTEIMESFNNVGKINMLSSWTVTTVGELGSVKGGKRLPKGSGYTDETTKYPYIRVSDFDGLSIDTSNLQYIDKAVHEKISRYTISKDDVFISIAGTIGKVGIIPEQLDGANLTENAAKITDMVAVNNRYLCYFLSSQDAQLQIARFITASNQPKLALFRIEKIRIPLAPIAEQHRIVAEIDKQLTRLDAALAALKRAQKNLERYKASVLKAACEGRLVPQNPDDEPAEKLLERILAVRRRRWEMQEWEKQIVRAKKKAAQAKRKQAGKPARIKDLAPGEWEELPEKFYGLYLPKNDKWKEKYKEPARPDTSDLPELPAGWAWVSANQVCDPIPNGSTPKADELFQETGEVPFIKVYNLTFNGDLDFSIKPTYIERITHTGLLKRSIILPGDVLMNIVGPPLGKVSIVPDIYHEWNINQAIVSFRTLTQELNNRFLSYVLMGPNISTSRLYKTSKTTAGQRNLNVSACRKMELPLPPVNEQKRVTEEVERQKSIVEALQRIVDENLYRSERLRQSILHMAFQGELVSQDPEDEPASMLLERIRSQRLSEQMSPKI